MVSNKRLMVIPKGRQNGGHLWIGGIHRRPHRGVHSSLRVASARQDDAQLATRSTPLSNESVSPRRPVPDASTGSPLSADARVDGT